MVDEPQADFTGSWASLKETSSSRVSPTFRYAMNTENAEPTATATFRPKLPASGKYHVEIASTPGRNRSPKVPCVISGADGETVVIMDQTLKGGWHRVADNIQFHAGISGFVQIRNNCGALGTNDKIVLADAVRFIPSGDSTSGFQLTVTSDGGGKVLVDPNKKNFSPGAEVSLVAQPEEGYIFAGWSGALSGMLNPARLVMENNKRINASFVLGNPGVIMDAGDASLTGDSWMPNPPKWGARTNYQFASTCTDGSTKVATAVYQPNISKAGLYDVYIWYSKGPNRADNAPWEISGKNKTVTVKVNQQLNGGDWFPIASGIEFDAGKKGYVKLSNVTGQPNFVVVADSVAFVYVGKP